MVEGRHFRVRDLDALWIGVAIEFAADFETGFRRGVGDQFDDDEEAEEWRRAPVLRDVAEHAMLDLVPLRSPWRIGANLNDQTGFVRELLEGQLPEPQPRTIGAAAVGRDHQAPHPGIELPTHLIEPASDGVDGELPGVVIDSEADIAEVGADVVDPVRDDLAQLLVLEIVSVDLDRFALRPIVATAVLEFAQQFLLLRVDRYHGFAGRLNASTFALIYSNWASRSGCLPASLVLRLEWRQYFSSSSSKRVAALVDARNFAEFIGPERREISPHLSVFDLPAQFDDSIVVGSATIDGKRVPVAAQEGLDGPAGCFNGCGLIAGRCSTLIVSEHGRISVPGPEVIETNKGVGEFDSRDRAFVWRTVGGKDRTLIRGADVFVEDDTAAFRYAAVAALAAGTSRHRHIGGRAGAAGTPYRPVRRCA